MPSRTAPLSHCVPVFPETEVALLEFVEYVDAIPIQNRVQLAQSPKFDVPDPSGTICFHAVYI